MKQENPQQQTKDEFLEIIEIPARDEIDISTDGITIKSDNSFIFLAALIIIVGAIVICFKKIRK